MIFCLGRGINVYENIIEGGAFIMESFKKSLSKTVDRELNPPRVLALGFGMLILLGAILLNLPIATQTGERVGFINAFFTSSSAVCVTGLVVKNTAEYWSNFGHVVIISLIQMGGLGFMTMATIVALLVGKKITFTERLVIKEQLNQETMTGLVKLTKYVIGATFLVEGLGAIFLSTKFIPMYGLGKGLWFSVFHAISAFCNAGFDIMGSSLEPYVGDLTLNLTLATLVILGGLGFSVYIDISRNRKFGRLKLHSKLVIVMTILLLVLGTVLIFITESQNPETMLNFTPKEKIVSSFFQSAISRTAGFNSINLSGMRESTVIIIIMLMFVGGSPGSTAGGVKTTTFGVLLFTTRAVIRGDKDVTIFKKRINQSIVNRSLAIFMVGILLVLSLTLFLTFTEDANFLDLLFETTSAFATVGLSRSLSPNLTNIGKIVIALTMYAGRVGPLTMAFAFAQKERAGNFRYSEGNITVG